MPAPELSGAASIMVTIALAIVLPSETHDASVLFWVLAVATFAVAMGVGSQRSDPSLVLISGAGCVAAALAVRGRDVGPLARVLVSFAPAMGGPAAVLAWSGFDQLVRVPRRVSSVARAASVGEILDALALPKGFGSREGNAALRAAAERRIRELAPSTDETAAILRPLVDRETSSRDDDQARDRLAGALVRYLGERWPSSKAALAGVARGRSGGYELREALRDAFFPRAAREDRDLLAAIVEERLARGAFVGEEVRALVAADAGASADLAIRAFEAGRSSPDTLTSLPPERLYETLRRAVESPRFADTSHDTNPAFLNMGIVLAAASLPRELNHALLSLARERDGREVVRHEIAKRWKNA